MEQFSPTTPASHLRSRLAEIDATIFDFEAQIALLRAEQELVSESLSRIVYPVLTLPPEMTIEIFLSYVNIGASSARDQNLIHNPLPLAGVCRAWRDVAMSTSALWNRINLNTYVARNAEKLLEAWILRSGSLPLDLDIMVPYASPVAGEILGTLAKCSSRWRDFRLDSNSPIPFPPGSIRGPLTSLKTLRILVAVPGDCMTSFLDAPELRHAAITVLSKAQISLPWNCLARLELDEQTFSECLGILQETINLETLRVSLDTREPSGLVRCTLPYLRELDITDEDSIKLLPHLDLPALKSLAVQSLQAAGVVMVKALIIRSNCTLLALQLTNTDMLMTLNCLHDIPSISELTLNAPDFTVPDFNSFCGRMIVDGPAIHTFNLNLPDYRSHVGVNLFSEMLAAGWEAKTLRSASLSVDGSFRDDRPDVSIALLRELRRQGLDLKVQCTRRWISDELTSRMADEIMCP
ncbi:hypothetical protein C8R46DRAFT_1117166 [Mycena filopes]|nr:hypothetical protein C8R46DRAFT_1117166 [Mycena filopes]